MWELKLGGTSALSRLDLPTLGRPTIAMASGSATTSTSSVERGGGKLATSASNMSPVPVPLMADSGNGCSPRPQNSAACKGPHQIGIKRCQLQNDLMNGVYVRMKMSDRPHLEEHCQLIVTGLGFQAFSN